MKRWPSLAFSLVCFVGPAAWAQPDTAKAPPEPEPPQVAVFSLENASAADAATVLESLFKQEPVRIVPEPVTNTIFVLGAEKELQSVEKLIRILDRSPATIEIEVTILETAAAEEANVESVELSGNVEEVRDAIQKMKQAGTLKVLERLHATTFENQIAKFQVGKHEPVVRGRTTRGFSRDVPGSGSVPVVEMEKVGTMLTATARVSGEDVMIEIAVEKSWIRPPATDDETDEIAEFASTTDQISLASTVKVPAGQSVYLGSKTIQTGESQSRLLVILTARVRR